jgi:hypothetical protein
MALNNRRQIEQQAQRLLDRVILIHNRDGRLRIAESIYKAHDFFESASKLAASLIDFQGSETQDVAVVLLNSTRRYISAVDAAFKSARPRFLTAMKQSGGPQRSEYL